jgi:hypothetical protein
MSLPTPFRFSAVLSTTFTDIILNSNIGIGPTILNLRNKGRVLKEGNKLRNAKHKREKM